MKMKFLNLKSAVLSVGLLSAVMGLISVSHSGCGPDDAPTTTTTPTTTTIEEFIILDGKRYEGKDFYKKQIVTLNTETYLNIKLNPVYPLLNITHEREEKSDTMVARIYNPAFGASSGDDFGWDVYFFGAYGSEPLYCNYGSSDKPKIPHGKYELKKINGKYVSTFGKIQMDCEGGVDPTSLMVVEGQVIWENKN